MPDSNLIRFPNPPKPVDAETAANLARMRPATLLLVRALAKAVAAAERLDVLADRVYYTDEERYAGVGGFAAGVLENVGDALDAAESLLDRLDQLTGPEAA